MKCKQTHKGLISEFSMPEKKTVKDFIKLWRKRLSKNQIRILNLLSDNVEGFYFHSHEQVTGVSMSSTPISTSAFVFEQDGIKGEIIITI